VWLAETATQQERKVAAIGVRVSRGVTMHGFALNCDLDLAWYDRFVPCGISDAGVTSLSLELGRDVRVAEVAPVVERHLARLLSWAPYERTADLPSRPERGTGPRVPVLNPLG
jgi:lipoyl(octanoyl) transferase